MTAATPNVPGNIPIDQLPDDLLVRRLVFLEALRLRQKIWQINQYDPTGQKYNRRHEKQVEFHKVGQTHDVRAFFGGNRTGKSVSGGAEDTYHLTGLYPNWWEGRVFDCPTRGWVGSDTAESTRDGIQRVLMGPPDDFGTGLIPRERIISYTWKRGVAQALDSVLIEHRSSSSRKGVSELSFKSYDQGRRKWQGVSRHFVHFDEEPPLDIYREGQQRVNDTSGIILLTMTPLSGMSDVAMLFFGDDYESAKKAGIRYRVQAGWQDNPHLDPETIRKLRADLPEHELEAREHGRPQLGSGKIYPFTREQIIVPTFDVPKTWPRGMGMDFGWRWTGASVQGYDEEGDTIYVYGEYKEGQKPIEVHATALRAFGPMPISADPAGWSSNQIDGRKAMVELKKYLPNVRNADNAVAAGILDCYQRFASGRLKIMAHCVHHLQEFDVYRRDDDGKVVKENDHCMDSMRYCARKPHLFEVQVKLPGQGRQSHKHYAADAVTGY